MPNHFSSSHAVDLSGIPETLLWTLHHRASEAVRPDAFLDDPEAVRVYRSIRFDYDRRFGKPDESHPMRARLFDRAVRPWIMEHPGGTVVELGCGLETQFHRCDDGEVQWRCVDLPEALDLRARFLPAGPRCRFIRKSALDLTWMDGVDGRRGLFVTAQGLFMYFEERDVRYLLTALFERFPGVELMFDAIPVWFSKKTLRGYQKTTQYRAPRMPWGVDHDDVEPTLRAWSPRVTRVQVDAYGVKRSLPGLALRLFAHLPKLRNRAPTVVRVSTG